MLTSSRYELHGIHLQVTAVGAWSVGPRDRGGLQETKSRNPGDPPPQSFPGPDRGFGGLWLGAWGTGTTQVSSFAAKRIMTR